MTLTLEKLASIINDLSYLYTEHGSLLTADEAAVTRDVINISTNQGIEFLDKEQVEFAIALYKKYENKDLTNGEQESGEME